MRGKEVEGKNGEQVRGGDDEEETRGRQKYKLGRTGENRQHRENVKRRQERWTERKNTRGQRWKERRRRRSIRRRCSFLLWKSFQNGVHLLRNGRQRKLKLVLRGDKGGEQKRGGKLKTDTKEPKLLESRMD